MASSFSALKMGDSLLKCQPLIHEDVNLHPEIKKVDGSTSEGALLPGKELDSVSVGKVTFHVC